MPLLDIQGLKAEYDKEIDGCRRTATSRVMSRPLNPK
jgi:hypothetical protein